MLLVWLAKELECSFCLYLLPEFLLTAAHPALGLQVCATTYLFENEGSRDQIQVIMLASQAIYKLSQLPSQKTDSSSLLVLGGQE